MKFLQRFFRLGRAAKSPGPAWVNPIDKLLTLMLAQAEEPPFSAIIIGAAKFPNWKPGQLDDMMTDWDRSKNERLQQARAAARATGDHLFDLQQEAHDKSRRLRHVKGWESIPVFSKVGDLFYSMMPIPISVYTGFLDRLESRLLSLNGSPEAPQPRRYIEYTLPDYLLDVVAKAEPKVRKFAEVDLVIADDSSVWINILGFRSEPQTVHTSTGCY